MPQWDKFDRKLGEMPYRFNLYPRELPVVTEKITYNFSEQQIIFPEWSYSKDYRKLYPKYLKVPFLLIFTFDNTIADYIPPQIYFLGSDFVSFYHFGVRFIKEVYQRHIFVDFVYDKFSRIPYDVRIMLVSQSSDGQELIVDELTFQNTVYSTETIHPSGIHKYEFENIYKGFYRYNPNDHRFYADQEKINSFHRQHGYRTKYETEYLRRLILPIQHIFANFF
jgi:hypothetical protein